MSDFSFVSPWLVVLAVLGCGALVLGYRYLQRQRAQALSAAGLSAHATGWARLRRHVPPLFFLAALTLLLLALARPQVTVEVPRAAGTMILAFDVSNSMT